MSSIKSKVSYIRGLMDGLDVKEDTKEGKVLIEIVKVLDEMAERLEEVEDCQNEFQEYLESINDDLSNIEEGFYEDCYDDCDLDDFVELQCPQCSETVYIEEDMLESHDCIKCPNCQFNIIGSKKTVIENKNND